MRNVSKILTSVLMLMLITGVAAATVPVEQWSKNELRISTGDVDKIGNIVFSIKNTGNNVISIDNVSLTVKNVKTGQIVFDHGEIGDSGAGIVINPGSIYKVTWYNYKWGINNYEIQCVDIKYVPPGTRACPGAPIGTYKGIINYNGKDYNTDTFKEKLQTYIVLDVKLGTYVLGCDIKNRCKRYFGYY